MLHAATAARRQCNYRGRRSPPTVVASPPPPNPAVASTLPAGEVKPADVAEYGRMPVHTVNDSSLYGEEMDGWVVRVELGFNP